MIPRRRFIAGAASTAGVLASPAIAAGAPGRAEVLAAMRQATAFMTDKVAVNGGYVWSCLPDFSRRWGEMEAFPRMIWVQPPGTATMGHLFLDAFHATGEEIYYAAADKAAGALIAGQLPSGGWNYMIDFAGEESLRRWYATIGRNAWRLEEFQHYWGNATFDDAGTSEAMQFLLRMYVERRDPKIRAPLGKAVALVLGSQQPSGGWPQRYPRTDALAKDGRPDYTGYVTFNDDVAGENIKFLLMVRQSLGDQSLAQPIRRAMQVFLATQQPAPQAGWALQYTPDLKPAGARSYEPLALATHTTATNIDQLMVFHRLTGDAAFLDRIPEALDWLESVKLAEPTKEGRTHPTFIEIGSNRPLYVHRRGSNVVNGAYFVNHDPVKTIGHYSATRKIDLTGLRTRYAAARALSPAEASRGSPLLAEGLTPLPRYFALGDIQVSDLNSSATRSAAPGPAAVRAILAELTPDGWWPTPLRSTSNPYAGDGSPEIAPGDFATTNVGDRTDTSPYLADQPVIGISTGTFIQKMATLIRYLDGASPSA
ncbi:MAG: pectate lyase [Caulobacter sp.]|nr:pectate lyase [Caulobacter sp.]